MRLAGGAMGCSVRTPTCSSLREIAGNRDPWAVLRGCEGPQPDAKVASDPGAPSHFACASFTPPHEKDGRPTLGGAGGRKVIRCGCPGWGGDRDESQIAPTARTVPSAQGRRNYAALACRCSFLKACQISTAMHAGTS
jgi:hypothetical protein